MANVQRSIPPWPCCGARGVHLSACPWHPENRHYCPSCDEFSARPHRHIPEPALTLAAWLALVVVITCPFVFLYLYVTGLPR